MQYYCHEYKALGIDKSTIVAIIRLSIIAIIRLSTNT